jgi:hypothetical protein
MQGYKKTLTKHFSGIIWSRLGQPKKKSYWKTPKSEVS